MKYLIFLICFSVFTISNAQIDSRDNSFAIPAEDTEDPKADNKANFKPDDKNSINPDEAAENETLEPITKPSVEKKVKEFTMFDKENYKNPAEQFTGKLKNALKFEEDRERKNNGSTVNQFLGQFKTTAKIVNIIYRDHQYPDGDMIRVYVNEEIAVNRVTLTSQVNGLNLVLEDGINKIDFYALNQGTSGPNTAEFRILDENGVVISSNQWNLATGVKATIILLKEDGQLKLSEK
ncbi:hypothetical protein [Aurantibacter aestuarii]|uniref:Secreted protein n=1 Tax=Aurantibacter aestuarii TaxID=1266046 RepID=A0A2T1N8Q9_9FLAO|nr:hypothetical protein [Aurantibacter aestuarii]PSG88254.1 hypothetical protein C7H52_08075 [Aurantibacter aestuarii]